MHVNAVKSKIEFGHCTVWHENKTVMQIVLASVWMCGGSRSYRRSHILCDTFGRRICDAAGYRPSSIRSMCLKEEQRSSLALCPIQPYKQSARNRQHWCGWFILITQRAPHSTTHPRHCYTDSIFVQVSISVPSEMYRNSASQIRYLQLHSRCNKIMIPTLIAPSSKSLSLIYSLRTKCDHSCESLDSHVWFIL
jgi:hypothetical protein